VPYFLRYRERTAVMDLVRYQSPSLTLTPSQREKA
jgi:hypothetical protein